MKFLKRNTTSLILLALSVAGCKAHNEDILPVHFAASMVSGSEQPDRNENTPRITHLTNAAPEKVLFVGNSYLYYNDSLHNHVKRIIAEANPSLSKNIRFKSATIGGASLSHHAMDSHLEPGRLGIDEPFDLVILQGGSGEVLSERRREVFTQKATEFSGKIKATGAQTALYMTHAYVKPHKKYDPAMINDIERAYVTTGNRINALVIPVGLAFKRAYALRPDMQLHKAFDGTHPSLLGTYLAACVVYASVYHDSTSGLKYDYFGKVSQADAAFLQSVADETVAEFFGR